MYAYTHVPPHLYARACTPPPTGQAVGFRDQQQHQIAETIRKEVRISRPLCHGGQSMPPGVMMMMMPPGVMMMTLMPPGMIMMMMMPPHMVMMIFQCHLALL